MTHENPLRDLREELLALTYACPKGRYETSCPFAMLGGLSHGTREVVLDRMDYKELVSLFDFVPQCRCPADPRHARCGVPTVDA